MSILINATNIKVGGGLQVAISVIDSLLVNPRGESIYFVTSSKVYQQLSIPEEKLKNVFVCDFCFKNVFSFIKSYKYLNKLEKKFNISVVFTIFGPSYWHPVKAKHLIGFANAWLVSPNSKAYTIFSSFIKWKQKIKNYILRKLLFKKGAVYVTETLDMQEQFCKVFKCEKDRVSVVGNCISQHFIESSEDADKFGLRDIKKFKFVTISHNYPHKNLKTIPLVGQQLEKNGFDFTFIVTIDFAEYELLDSEFKKYTTNIGPIDIIDCKAVYKACDALYLPTLIECFTVSYLEAMASNTLILTSDLPFARNICLDSAFYFNPYSVNDISEVLETVLREFYINSQLIHFKKSLYPSILLESGDNDTKVDSYMAIIKKLKGSLNV